METYNQLTDYELIVRFVAGDQTAIQELITRHRSKVYTYILLTVKNEMLAEDIFQDTFVKVIKCLLQDKYQDNGKFVSWVMRISHNLIIDHYRKLRQMPTISNESCSYDIFNSKSLSDNPIEDEMLQQQLFDEIRDLVNLLPEEQRQVVVMRHYAGLSFKEIADQTEVSINTALGRMRYALINLRRMLHEKEVKLSNC
jgi:RNA polymerase sigma-70 factor (ECF subfamily)